MFHEDSQMPEHYQGHNEVLAAQEKHTVNHPNHNSSNPSVAPSDPWGLEAAGKSFLLRRYNVQVSAAGNPYFVPIESLLLAHQRDAAAVLELARTFMQSDEGRRERAAAQANKGIDYFLQVLELAGEGRDWVARKRVIWPLTDELGFQLYKAASGIDELADFAAYLLRTDSNIQTMEDVEADERYVKRKFWSDVALAEAGELDAIIQQIEETDYNLDALIRNGYRQQASLDTRSHLQGVQERREVKDETAKVDVKAALMARRVA